MQVLVRKRTVMAAPVCSYNRKSYRVTVENAISTLFHHLMATVKEGHVHQTKLLLFRAYHIRSLRNFLSYSRTQSNIKVETHVMRFAAKQRTIDTLSI